MAPALEEKLRDLMHERGLTLASAESCTGGLVSHRITNVSGSSEFFPGGLVTYSYESKAKLLEIPWETLNGHGAVSEETVLAMARGARKLFGTDISVSVSGIAGPTGGTADKPVGTTWVGFSAVDGEWARHFLWEGDRERNKLESSEAALQMVVDYLEGKLI
jgi:PncC family amidohydrolase